MGERISKPGGNPGPGGNKPLGFFLNIAIVAGSAEGGAARKKYF
jgi:hypothetical protein